MSRNPGLVFQGWFFGYFFGWFLLYEKWWYLRVNCSGKWGLLSCTPWGLNPSPFLSFYYDIMVFLLREKHIGSLYVLWNWQLYPSGMFGSGGSEGPPFLKEIRVWLPFFLKGANALILNSKLIARTDLYLKKERFFF